MRFFLAYIMSFSLFLAAEHEFSILTVPKCGTHLLVEIVKKITQKEPFGISDLATISDPNVFDSMKDGGKFIFSHNFSDEQMDIIKRKKMKVLFIYRDPRDQLVSMIHWLKYLPEFPVSQMVGEHNQIRELITGDLYGYTCFEKLFVTRFKQIRKLKQKNILMIRFEDIVGSKGGGNNDSQLSKVLQIAKFLKIKLSSKKAEIIASSIWGKSATFRKGTVGQWRDVFTQEDVELYKEKYGKMLINLGYEKNLNW